MSATGYASDPLLGAEVSPPPLELIGTDPATRTALFRPTGDQPFRLHFGADDVLRASLGQMRYNGADNMLVADLFNITLAGAPAGSPFFDAGLAPFVSPWLDQIAGILDPAAPEFQADTVLHLSYHPLGNLWDLTDGFRLSAEAEITNLVYTVHVVSEPPAVGLVAGGCLALLCMLRVGRKIKRRGLLFITQKTQKDAKWPFISCPARALGSPISHPRQ